MLAGRWLATIGLLLCVASAVLPVSHNLIQRAIRIHQAETFGRDWVAMVTSGNLKQAFLLTVEATRPAPAAEPGPQPKASPYETFIAQPLIKALQAAGDNADIRIRDTVDYQATTYRNITVRQLYSVSPAPLLRRAPVASQSSLSSRFNGQPFPVKACRAGWSRATPLQKRPPIHRPNSDIATESAGCSTRAMSGTMGILKTEGEGGRRGEWEEEPA